MIEIQPLSASLYAHDTRTHILIRCHTFAVLNKNTDDKMNNNTPTDIKKLIDTMSVEELRQRLYDYMLADNKPSRPVAIVVRLKDISNRGGRYDVLFIMENGEEVEVKFTDRHSRLIYIYTLIHAQGYQRRSLTKNDYQPLRELFSKIYFADSSPLMKAIGDHFDRYMNQSVAQARVAVRKAIADSEDFEIARPQRHGGKLLVNFAAANYNNEEAVFIDTSLR